jgi:hypothetical protein
VEEDFQEFQERDEFLEWVSSKPPVGYSGAARSSSGLEFAYVEEVADGLVVRAAWMATRKHYAAPWKSAHTIMIPCGPGIFNIMYV